MKDFFRRTVLHNFGLKLLSLALASALWFVLANDPVTEVAVEVPIIFRNVPTNLGMSYERIPRAEILLRGPQRAVRRLQPSDVQAEINVGDGKPGPRAFRSNEVEVHHPHELQVLNVGPEQFQVTFMELLKSSAVQTPADHP